jgi:hypothetical protein
MVFVRQDTLKNFIDLFIDPEKFENVDELNLWYYFKVQNNDQKIFNNFATN